MGLVVMAIASCSTFKKENHNENAPVRDSLNSALNQFSKQGQFNGFSVAIVNEKGTLYTHGFGLADVKSGKPYTQNTIQNIGSISKTLVGIALVKAQELGKLKLDEPINNYLPFKVQNPYYPNRPITIRQLATHTSTITDNAYYLKKNYILKPGQNLDGVSPALEEEQVINPYDSVVGMETYFQRVLAADGQWYQKEDFLQRQPGELFEYSNVATALAAYIIERATGEPFNAFTRRYILKPLQMNASGWKFDEVDMAQHSRLYQSPKVLLPYYSLITYPDGNFITSSEDLAKYLTELIKGYSGHGTLLSKEGYAEYFRPQLTAKNFEKRNEKNPYSDEYNVGIFMGFSVAGNIGHTGGDPGVSTMLFFDPKTKIGRLLIVNTNINDKNGNDAFYGIWNVLEKYQNQLKN